MSKNDPRSDYFKSKCPLCKLPARDMVFRVECMTVNCKNYSEGAKKEYLDHLSNNLPTIAAPSKPILYVDLSWDDEEETTKPMSFDPDLDYPEPFEDLEWYDKRDRIWRL